MLGSDRLWNENIKLFFFRGSHPQVKFERQPHLQALFFKIIDWNL